MDTTKSSTKNSLREVAQHKEKVISLKNEEQLLDLPCNKEEC